MGGTLIYVPVRRFLRHMAVLPTCIAVIFFMFYIAVYATGSSVEEATDMGWIPKTDTPPVWYRTWDYLKFDKVVWRSLPSQTLNADEHNFAIELELNHSLDYNHELKMVGLSNIVSVLTGGYTGSYIFSQSIFSLRYDSNVGSRVF
jgi:SulP family sulfate permease